MSEFDAWLTVANRWQPARDEFGNWRAVNPYLDTFAPRICLDKADALWYSTKLNTERWTVCEEIVSRVP
jgi:hypothetical protein